MYRKNNIQFVRCARHLSRSAQPSGWLSYCRNGLFCENPRFFFWLTYEYANPNHPDEIYFAGTQFINTYSVDLSENLPHFEVPLSSGTITFLPACEANSSPSAVSSTSKWTACAMTDLKVESINYDSNNNLVSGSFTVVWEDATSGSDFDMDGIERLAF